MTVSNHGFRWFVRSVALAVVLLSGQAQAECIRADSARLSAAAFQLAQNNRAIAAGAGALTGPAALAVGAVVAGAGIGMTAGQLINIGIARWWDPEIEVFAQDASDIVRQVSDTQIDGIIGALITRFDTTSSLTLADLLALNTYSAGFGDASLELVRTSVRAFVHVSQGAAAFAEHGYGAPDVVQAAGLLDADLDAYRTAITNYVPFLDSFDATGVFSRLTRSGFSAYLDSYTGAGPEDLQSELRLAAEIFNLAGVSLQGVGFSDIIFDDHLSGNFLNTLAEIPIDGFTVAQVMQNGVAAFDVNCAECDIAIARRVPLPPTSHLVAIAFVMCWVTRKNRPAASLVG